MKTKDEWRYEIQEGRACILEYLGEDMEVRVPASIEGAVVTAIGKKAFYEKKNLSKVYLPEGLEQLGEYAFSECRTLCEIELPASLLTVSRHAFYNCRRLEKISLWDSVENIEDGAFKNCYKLAFIRLFLKTRKNIALKQILYDVHHAIQVELWEEEIAARLRIPEYSLDSQVDINSRAFHEVIHGLGSMFRDWVAFQYLNFEKYDAFFAVMCREEKLEEAAKMALDRLRFPFMLSKEAKSEYEKYVEEHMREVISYLIKASAREKLIWILGQNFSIERRDIDACMDESLKAGKNEFTVLLMSYRGTHYKKREKSFEL